MRIILALLLLTSCYASVGTAVAQTPIGFNTYQVNDTTEKVQFGKPVANYQDSTGWHPIESDWILNGDSMFTNWRSVLKTTVTQDGISVITITWQGNDYTITQEPIGIAWVNTDTWEWNWIDNTLTWNTPTVDSSIIHWAGISPGIDYRIRKSRGSVEHGVFFSPAFLDSAVTLFDQRPDSADLALCNISRYTFSINLDNPDSVHHRVNKRLLKRIANMVFSLTEQRLHFPGSDALPPIPVERHEKRIGGAIYGAEIVDGSRIKQIHEALPGATIWHNATVKLEDDTKMRAGVITSANADANSGTQTNMDCGCRSGDQNIPVWYDTAFTETIQAGSLWLKIDAKRFFVSADDTNQVAVAWGERVYYEGVDSDPADSGATWSHYDYPDSAWTTAGGLGSGDTVGVEFAHTLFTPGTAPAEETWIGLKICGAESEWPPTGVTMLMVYQYLCDGDNYWRYHSDDHGTAANRPYMEFTYTEDGVPAVSPRRRKIISGGR